MSNDNNRAPFNWNTLMDKAIWALLAGMMFWVYTTHERVNKLDDYEKTKSMHWQIHAQQRDAHNDLVETINERREPGEPKIDRLKWNIDPDKHLED